MALITTRPSSSVAGDSTVTGAATRHAAMSDNSDSSYMTVTGDSPTFVNFSNPSVPAGRPVVAIVMRLRTSNPSSPQISYMQITEQNGTGWLTERRNVRRSIGWATPTTGGVILAGEIHIPATIITSFAIPASFLSIYSSPCRIYEAYFDTYYVAKPDLSVVFPTDTLSTTNIPEVVWVPDLDSLGGKATAFQVKIFDDTTYGGGGFDPDTSTPDADSGEIEGTGTAGDWGTFGWQVPVSLENDTYRAYVKIAQDVRGVRYWSDWEHSDFVIDTAVPDAPTIDVTPEDDEGRIGIVLASGGGAATTDGAFVQRSFDGGVNWEDIRTVFGQSAVIAADFSDIKDYEIGNGQDVLYRARAISIDTDGGFGVSDNWTEASAAEHWESDDYWLKHATNPTLNIKVNNLTSYPGKAQAGRVTSMQPIGASKPIVVTDTRGGPTGTVKIQFHEDTERETMDAILNAVSPLLLQLRPGDHEQDRWLVPGDQDRARYVDHASFAATEESVTWIEVDRPLGNLESWT